MRLNFKKISAIVTSTLMVGLSMGGALAANYPAPFIEGGQANVAIVYGTGQGVSGFDMLWAGNIQTDLQARLGSGTTGTSTTVTGEAVSLDTSATRIWMNTSLNTAKSTITKEDLPTILAEQTFSGNAEAKLTSTLKLQSGAAGGGDNSGKVIFARQPKSSDDPVVGISLGTSATSSPLYNASVTFSKAVNFTSTESEGEQITLFGQDFTVSADTDGTSIVLLKEAQKFSLDSDNPSSTVTIDGETYTVELVSASDSAATIRVTDSAGTVDSKEVNEADSKKINGLEIGVITADETNLKLSATVIAGADKITLTSAATVTMGSDNDPVDGTTAYIVGGTTATTEIAIIVYRPDSSSDAILSGSSFSDPVFGTFKFDFAGQSTALDDTTNRDTIEIGSSGDDTLTVDFTNDDGYQKAFDWAHNVSSRTFLADDTNNTIKVLEKSNVTEDVYLMIGNEEYGHLLQVSEIYNSSSTSAGDDRIKFLDVMTGDTIAARSPSTEGSTTLDLDGKEYTVTYRGPGDGAGSGGWATIKYPSTDSPNASTLAIYPTIKTKGGALVALYEPLSVDLSSATGDGAGTDANALEFPDGDGWTSIETVTNTNTTWTIEGVAGGTNNTGSLFNVSGVAVGRLKYSFNFTVGSNTTTIYLIDPESNTTITTPALVVFEPKDDSTLYEVMVVKAEVSAGTSSNGIGVDDVTISSPTHFEATLQSDGDITKIMDWFGSLVTIDANDADQKVATISVPKSQVFNEIYVGEVASEISAGTSGTSGSGAALGEVVIKDSEVSSYSGKNLIVIGGSCINSAAATLVGGAVCGSAWTEKTNVGTGQFIIKGYSGSTASNGLTTKLALLVAGYEYPDTINAAKYLKSKTVDTSKGYIGTTAEAAATEITTA